MIANLKLSDEDILYKTSSKERGRIIRFIYTLRRISSTISMIIMI